EHLADSPIRNCVATVGPRRELSLIPIGITNGATIYKLTPDCYPEKWYPLASACGLTVPITFSRLTDVSPVLIKCYDTKTGYRRDTFVITCRLVGTNLTAALRRHGDYTTEWIPGPMSVCRYKSRKCSHFLVHPSLGGNLSDCQRQ